MIDRQSLINASDLARRGDLSILNVLADRLAAGEAIEGPSLTDAPTAVLVDVLRERGVETLSYPRTERIKMALDSLRGVIDSNERSLRELEATPADEEASRGVPVEQGVLVDWIRAKREVDRLTDIIRREFRAIGGIPEGADRDAAYRDAIQEARSLLDPITESRGSEYARGQVALIAGMFGVHGMPTDERMIEVARDIDGEVDVLSPDVIGP